MRGLTCSKCNKSLTKPFNAVSFDDLGREKRYRNSIPKMAGKGLLVVYEHEDCRIQGRRRHNRSNLSTTPIEIPKGVRQYSSSGFRVKADGARLLLVLPERAVN